MTDILVVRDIGMGSVFFSKYSQLTFPFNYFYFIFKFKQCTYLFLVTTR